MHLKSPLTNLCAAMIEAGRWGQCGLVAIALLMTMSCSKQEPASPAAKGEPASPARQMQTVRVGWQIAWATQGQLAMVLQKTDLLKDNGLRGDFKSFTYGAPLSEAALGGQLDVAFVGDQPAVSLLSRSTDWKIVARLMDFRVAIVVPTNSPIHTIADLKGKTLGIPFGASTHRVALQWLKETGLDPEKDLKIINIDIMEQSDVVKAAGGGAWPKVDAFASWDHNIAMYENQGYAKVLKSGTALGVVLMSKTFIDQHPSAAASFVAAFKQGYLYYATHQDAVDKWFSEAAGGKFDLSILKAVAEVEPNLKASTSEEVSINLGTDQLGILQRAADFALAQGLIKTPLKIPAAIYRRDF